MLLFYELALSFLALFLEGEMIQRWSIYKSVGSSFSQVFEGKEAKISSADMT